MNDNEIIKALECCNKPANEGGCLDCPLKEEKHKGCSGVMIENAIDLINRQKAEIEKLKDMVAQNEGVLPEYENFIIAEAIREFAERLKNEAETTWWFDDEEPTKVCTERLIPVSVMDEIVKEMTGERE